MHSLAKRLLAVVVTVVAILGVGVAYAAWTSTGTGTGTATAGTASSLTVTVGTASNLYPTGSVNVGFTVKNTDPYQVTLTNAHPQNITVDAGHSACNVASVTAADVPLTDVLAAGATSASHNVALSMSNAAVDACQGATFTFALVVSGASS
jgi:hypothetical protein